MQKKIITSHFNTTLSEWKVASKKPKLGKRLNVETSSKKEEVEEQEVELTEEEILSLPPKKEYLLAASQEINRSKELKKTNPALKTAISSNASLEAKPQQKERHEASQEDKENSVIQLGSSGPFTLLNFPIQKLEDKTQPLMEEPTPSASKDSIESKSRDVSLTEETSNQRVEREVNRDAAEANHMPAVNDKKVEHNAGKETRSASKNIEPHQLIAKDKLPKTEIALEDENEANPKNSEVESQNATESLIDVDNSSELLTEKSDNQTKEVSENKESVEVHSSSKTQFNGEQAEAKVEIKSISKANEATPQKEVEGLEQKEIITPIKTSLDNALEKDFPAQHQHIATPSKEDYIDYPFLISPDEEAKFLKIREQRNAKSKEEQEAIEQSVDHFANQIKKELTNNG